MKRNLDEYKAQIEEEFKEMEMRTGNIVGFFLLYGAFMVFIAMMVVLWLKFGN